MSETIHIEFDVPCSVEDAWDAVVDPAWLGDEGELDVRVDGEGWIRSGDEVHYLVVEEVDDSRRLTYRWASFRDTPSRVEIDLSPSDGGTTISIHETTLKASAPLCLAA